MMFKWERFTGKHLPKIGELSRYCSTQASLANQSWNVTIFGVFLAIYLSDCESDWSLLHRPHLYPVLLLSEHSVRHLFYLTVPPLVELDGSASPCIDTDMMKCNNLEGLLIHVKVHLMWSKVAKYSTWTLYVADMLITF